MRHGNWVPISKKLKMPTGRKYSEVEAAYSLQLIFDRSGDVTILGLAESWGWSRRAVNKFLKEMGVVIDRAKSSKVVQKQRGKLSVGIPKECELDCKRLIDNKKLVRKKRTENGQKKSSEIRMLSGSADSNAHTNKKTNTQPLNLGDFEEDSEPWGEEILEVPWDE